MNIKQVLENKIVLYVVLFFAVTNFFGYLLLHNYNAAIFMAIVGFGASGFSKNMIVILASSIVVTSLFVGGQTVKEGMASRNIREGFEDDQQQKSKESFKPALAPKTLPGKEEEEEEEGDDFKPATENTQKRMKAQAPNSIDQSATVEKAYERLDTLLGTDGVKGMSEGTNNILKNQTEMMNNLKNLEPLVNNAANMIENLESRGTLGKIEGMISKINNLKK
jgi:hypothetical protein